MLYKKICNVALSLYALLPSPIHGSTYYVSNSPSASYQCPSDLTDCQIFCDTSDVTTDNIYNCNNAQNCYFYCNELQCGKNAVINATNSNILSINQASNGEQCLLSSTIYSPDSGSAYFSTTSKSGFNYMTVHAGSNTQEIIIDTTFGQNDNKNDKEYEGIRVYAATAEYLRINIGTDLQWLSGTIECPVDSPYSGPDIAPCMIDATDGKIKDTFINAPDGTPINVYIEGCNKCDNVDLICGRVDLLNGAETGVSTYPFNAASHCWWTQEPTVDPTTQPTAPTQPPTMAPTFTPSQAPTAHPTQYPTMAPTTPTYTPSQAPTAPPTPFPTMTPTTPTYTPSQAPTAPPTQSPTFSPVLAPTHAPSATTYYPTSAPTPAPSPTSHPSKAPSKAPTKRPTKKTQHPTSKPTPVPTKSPKDVPTFTPVRGPTPAPTNAPIVTPTAAPSNPSYPPSIAPTLEPTVEPSAPSYPPTDAPSQIPTIPTIHPTDAPSQRPTIHPTKTLSSSQSPLISTEIPLNMVQKEVDVIMLTLIVIIAIVSTLILLILGYWARDYYYITPRKDVIRHVRSISGRKETTGDDEKDAAVRIRVQTQPKVSEILNAMEKMQKVGKRKTDSMSRLQTQPKVSELLKVMEKMQKVGKRKSDSMSRLQTQEYHSFLKAALEMGNEKGDVLFEPGEFMANKPGEGEYRGSQAIYSEGSDSEDLWNQQAPHPTHPTIHAHNPKKNSVELAISADVDGNEHRTFEAEQVATWMRNVVNLGEYAQVLIMHGYDCIESVKDLTMEDLLNIGVQKIGHRQKIYKYAQELTQ